MSFNGFVSEALKSYIRVGGICWVLRLCASDGAGDRSGASSGELPPVSICSWFSMGLFLGTLPVSCLATEAWPLCLKEKEAVRPSHLMGRIFFAISIFSVTPCSGWSPKFRHLLFALLVSYRG